MNAQGGNYCRHGRLAAAEAAACCLGGGGGCRGYCWHSSRRRRFGVVCLAAYIVPSGIK